MKRGGTDLNKSTDAVEAPFLSPRSNYRYVIKSPTDRSAATSRGGPRP